MSTSRTYGDSCGVARSLDVIGERWALLVVRELLLGPKRFSDLMSGLRGASQNVISQRLHELVGHGVVRRQDLGPPTRIRLYELTEWGRELEPAVLHLGSWGARAPLPDHGTLGIDSLVLGLKAGFDSRPSRGKKASYELHIDDHVFALELDNGALDARQGSAPSPDATITTSREALAAGSQGNRSLQDLLRTADLVIEGDQDAVELARVAFLGPALDGA